MATLDAVLLGYAGFISTASFIHLIRSDYWWIRIWDFPHLQLFILAAGGLIAWLVLNPNPAGGLWLIPLGLLGALVYQAWLIYPYTPLHRRQVSRQIIRTSASGQTDNLRLLVANVYMENTRMPDVYQLISKHRPDVVLLLETNEAWRQAMTPIEADYPYRVLCPLENTYGMLLYTRLPILHHKLRFLIQDDIPSIYAQLQLPSGQRLHFYGVHPMPPSPTEHYRSTERDAELLVVGKEARQQTEPVVVAGDLNDVAWSHTTRLFQRISGLLDPRIGRGLYSTFHAQYFFLRWPLDHVFVSTHFRLRSLKRLPNCGSDHFPILVELTANAKNPRLGEQPQPEDDDLEEVEDTIRRATQT